MRISIVFETQSTTDDNENGIPVLLDWRRDGFEQSCYQW
jgi:hypothetical protein